jgi:hypothetical protein
MYSAFVFLVSHTKMKYLVIILVLISTPLSAEEECVFDQAAQKAKYIELQKKYPGSQYIESEYKLVIPRGTSQISLSRGGCVHFGITIEETMPLTHRFQTEDAFFEKILALVTEFGQELVTPEELAQIITQKKWKNLSGDHGMYYFIPLSGLTAFEAYQRDEGNQTTIGASFYI